MTSVPIPPTCCMNGAMSLGLMATAPLSSSSVGNNAQACRLCLLKSAPLASRLLLTLKTQLTTDQRHITIDLSYSFPSYLLVVRPCFCKIQKLPHGHAKALSARSVRIVFHTLYQWMAASYASCCSP